MKSIQEEADEDLALKLIITYFPMAYESVIEKQYESAYMGEYKYIHEWNVEILKEAKEVYAQFNYVSDTYENDVLEEWIGREEELSKTVLPYWEGIKWD